MIQDYEENTVECLKLGRESFPRLPSENAPRQKQRGTPSYIYKERA